MKLPRRNFLHLTAGASSSIRAARSAVCMRVIAGAAFDLFV